VRAHYALTRLSIEAADVRRQRHEQEAMVAFLEEIRRAVDASITA
jgi:hypothetical protein